ncbi:GtrA family protein [Geodermatophilus sp. SYSU D01180]
MPTLRGVRHRLSGAWRSVLRELSTFSAVGAACFVLDTGLFQLLYAWGTGAVTAKLVSTLVSTTAAYAGHRFWSFAHRERTGYRREYVVFALVNALTLSLGLALVAFVRHPLDQEHALVLQATNVVSIGLGTVVRWFAYRRWVFPMKAGADLVMPSLEPVPVRTRVNPGVAGVDPATTGA